MYKASSITVVSKQNKKAESSVEYLGQILDSFEFLVQRIQTDQGTEFFNDMFQEDLPVHFIRTDQKSQGVRILMVMWRGLNCLTNRRSA